MEVSAPWKHRRWRGGVCRPRLGGRAAGLFIAALAFFAVFAWFAAFKPDSLVFAKGRWLVLLPCGFAAAGLLSGLAAAAALARWLRFGRSAVRLRTMPGVIGGHFRGEVLLPERFPSDTDVRIELLCERTTSVSGRGDDSGSCTVKCLWSHTTCVRANPSCCRDGRFELPFHFEVPYGLPDETDDTSKEGSRVTVAWYLRVFARMAGPDLLFRVRVPVFRTPESDAAVKGDSYEGKSLDDVLRETGKPRRVRVECEAGVNVYMCDAQGLQKGLCVVPGVVGLVFLAAAVLVPLGTLPGLLSELVRPAVGWRNLARLFPLVFAVGLFVMMGVLALIGLIALLIGVKGLIFRRTWIEGGRICQRSRLFGIPWTRSCPRASATGVSYSDTTTSGSQTWYDVVIERDTVSRFEAAAWRYLFSRVTVATNVPTRQEAEELARRLRRELRLPEGATGNVSSGERENAG